jgi:hypothetical protein
MLASEADLRSMPRAGRIGEVIEAAQAYGEHGAA